MRFRIIGRRRNEKRVSTKPRPYGATACRIRDQVPATAHGVVRRVSLVGCSRLAARVRWFSRRRGPTVGLSGCSVAAARQSMAVCLTGSQQKQNKAPRRRNRGCVLDFSVRRGCKPVQETESAAGRRSVMAQRCEPAAAEWCEAGRRNKEVTRSTTSACYPSLVVKVRRGGGVEICPGDPRRRLLPCLVGSTTRGRKQ